MSGQQQAGDQSRRSLSGFVTKLVGDEATYGFINEEIFFQQALVSGGPALVGDQVFAECEYSAHLPIKWNATSVKILRRAQNNNSNQQQQQQQQHIPATIDQQQFQQSSNTGGQYGQQQQQPAGRMLDQNSSQDLYNQGSMSTSRLLPTPISEAQPALPAMGPASLAYTSQLGSAFVQNQPFVAPTPFLAQQPPLQMMPQQNLLPQNQRNQNNHNKGGFQNQGHDNNRMNNNNNNRRNDRRRSNDRDNSQRNNNNNNNRGGSNFRDNHSRDRSSGGSNQNKRSNDRQTTTRASPPAHLTSSRASSTSSDKNKPNKKNYEVENIPKAEILKDISVFNIKQRCSSSVHVPSDLKDIIVNKHFRLDLKNIPKPIKYTIEQIQPDPLKTERSNDNLETTGTTELKPSEDVAGSQTVPVSSATSTTGSCTSETSRSADVLPTPPTSKSDVRLNHKYGVKVLLVSLPDLEALYNNAFGPNLDSYNSDTKLNSRTDDVISLLCSKGSNGGHSLIGAKFDHVLDGFVEGQANEFERHGRQPDLINTCKRAVLDQTGFDLGPCQTWIKLATFIYNNKTDYFTPKASIEYSYIFVPAVWTMLSTCEQPTEEVKVEASKPEPQATGLGSESTPADDPVIDDQAEQQDEAIVVPETKVEEVKQEVDVAVVVAETPATAPEEPQALPTETKLSDLKVTDLKSRLDQLDVKYKSTAKKSELLSLLQESLLAASEAQQVEESQPNPDNNVVEAKAECEDTNLNVGLDVPATINQESISDQGPENKSLEPDTKKELEDGELGSVGSDDTDQMECDKIGDVRGEKRKLEDEDGDDVSAKKTCLKKEKAQLVTKAFKVNSSDQLPLSLFSLYNAARPSRHDQFELTVASTILKETLIQHFSEYIFTCLVEDYRERKSSSASATGGSSTSSAGSQEQQASDKNNNSSNSYKTPSAGQKMLFPIGRYINLAFSYFDASHLGYLQFDDLSKLFNSTGLTISKRALTALTSDTDTSSTSTSSPNDKFNYLSLPDLSPTKFEPTYIYQYPEQFSSLHNCTNASNPSSGGLIEFKGVAYDIEKLVQQVKDSEAVRVSLYDRFNYAIENSDKQAEEIHVLEVSQMSLSNAIKSQNDEICELKKERDNLKKKLENLRKGIKGTITNLTDLNKAAEEKS